MDELMDGWMDLLYFAFKWGVGSGHLWIGLSSSLYQPTGMDGWMDRWVGGWIDGWMDRWIIKPYFL